MKILSVLVLVFFVKFTYCQSNYEKTLLNKISKRLIEDTLKGKLYIDYGNIVMDKNPNEAILIFDKALQISNKENSKTLKANALQSISLCNLVLGNVKVAQTLAEEAFLNANESKHVHFIFQSAVHLADVYIDQLKFVEAKAKLDIAKEIFNNNYWALTNTGLYFTTLGKYNLRSFKLNDAINVYKQGMEISKKENQLNTMHSLAVTLGQIYFMRFKPDSAFYYTAPALAYFKANNNLVGEANVYEAIGLGYTFANNIMKAKENYNKALEIYTLTKDYPKVLETTMLIANMNYKSADFYGCLKVLKNVEPILENLENTAAKIMINLYKAHIYAMANDSNKYHYYYSKASIEAKKANYSGFNNLVGMAKFKRNTMLNIDSITDIETQKMVESVGKDVLVASIEPLINNTKLFYLPKDSLMAALQPSSKMDSLIINSYDSNSPITQKINSETVKADIENETNKNKKAYIATVVMITLASIGFLIYYILKRKKDKKREGDLEHNFKAAINSTNMTIIETLKQTCSPDELNIIKIRMKQSHDFAIMANFSSKNSNFSSNKFLCELLNYFATAFANNAKIMSIVEGEINKDQLMSIFQILQQLLYNSLKHGLKDNGEQLAININLKLMGTKLQLNYKDYGKGFEGENPFREGGKGMEIIKQNAFLLKSKEKIWSDNGFNYQLN